MKRLVLILAILLIGSSCFGAVYKNDANLQGLFFSSTTDYTTGSNVTGEDPNGYTLTKQSGDSGPTAYDFSSDDPKPPLGDTACDIEETDSEYFECAEASCANLDFSGADQKFSVCGWLKPETIDSGYLVAKFGPAGYTQWGVRQQGSGASGDIMIYISSTTQFTYSSGAAMVAGEWHHFAFVYNDTDVRVYIDGSLDEGGNCPDAFTDGTSDSACDFTIGCRDGQTSDYDGMVYEIAVFDRDLSAAEVNDIYTNGIQDAPSAGGQVIIIQ